MSTERDEANDGGYVHRPNGVDDDSTTADSAVDAPEGDADEDDPTSSADSSPYTGKADADGFGRQGWLLVAGVIVCFLGIPGFIYLNPTAPAQVGWTFFATFLVLPLIPAVILGLLAVWSMQAAA